MPAIPAAYDQDSYRFRNDDGNEAAATWLAALNTNASVTLDQNVRLRFLIQETAGGNSDVTFKLQSFHTEGTAAWEDVTGASGAARMAASTGLTEGADTTQQLGAGSFRSNNDGQEDNDGTIPDTAEDQANKEWEFEFCFQIRSAVVSPGDTVLFRVVSAVGVLDAYTRTPTATAASATPVYTQISFRGYEDDGAEGAATAKAPVNENWSQRADEVFRLRLTIQCTVAGETGFAPVMKYRIDQGAGYGAWANVPAAAGSVVQIASSPHFTNGGDTTQQIGAGSYTTDNNGFRDDPLGITSTLDTVAGEEWEAEWAISIDRALVDPGDTIQFKMTNNGTDLDTYEETPTVTVLATPPPFSNQPSGLSAAKRLLLHVGG